MRTAHLAALSLCAVASLAITSRSQADVVVYTANLSGPNESPANASPGVGSATITFDTILHTMRVQVSFSGLTGNTTASHIHASATMIPFTNTAGVATQLPSFSGFPLGVTSGTYDNTFDLTQSTSWNAAFITGNGGSTSTAEAALLSFAASGRAYLNIHSSTFGGGEIRGFLVPTPGAAGLLAAGGLVALRRRR
jgi:hypothetical protein